MHQTSHLWYCEQRNNIRCTLQAYIFRHDENGISFLLIFLIQYNVFSEAKERNTVYFWMNSISLYEKASNLNVPLETLYTYNETRMFQPDFEPILYREVRETFRWKRENIIIIGCRNVDVSWREMHSNQRYINNVNRGKFNVRDVRVW